MLKICHNLIIIFFNDEAEATRKAIGNSSVRERVYKDLGVSWGISEERWYTRGLLRSQHPAKMFEQRPSSMVSLLSFVKLHQLRGLARGHFPWHCTRDFMQGEVSNLCPRTSLRLKLMYQGYDP